MKAVVCAAAMAATLASAHEIGGAWLARQGAEPVAVVVKPIGVVRNALGTKASPTVALLAGADGGATVGFALLLDGRLADNVRFAVGPALAVRERERPAPGLAFSVIARF